MSSQKDTLWCGPINCHFWWLPCFFRSSFRRGINFHIMRATKTSELFSESLRVNKFLWWITWILSTLPFLIAPSRAPFASWIARGIWFILSLLVALIAQNQCESPVQPLCLHDYFCFYRWQWRKHKINKCCRCYNNQHSAHNIADVLCLFCTMSCFFSVACKWHLLKHFFGLHV